MNTKQNGFSILGKNTLGYLTSDEESTLNTCVFSDKNRQDFLQENPHAYFSDYGDKSTTSTASNNPVTTNQQNTSNHTLSAKKTPDDLSCDWALSKEKIILNTYHFTLNDDKNLHWASDLMQHIR